jgi:hypothetical protein
MVYAIEEEIMPQPTDDFDVDIAISNIDEVKKRVESSGEIAKC